MKQIKISAMFTKTPKLIAGQQMPIVPIEVAPNIGVTDRFLFPLKFT